MAHYVFENFDNTLLYKLQTLWFLPGYTLRRMVPCMVTTMTQAEGMAKVYTQSEVMMMRHISILNEAGRYINVLRLLNLYDHISNIDIKDLDKDLLVNWIKGMTIQLHVIVNPSINTNLLNGSFICKLPTRNNRVSLDLIRDTMNRIRDNINKRISRESPKQSIQGLFDWIKTTQRFENMCRDINRKIDSHMKDELFLQKLARLGGKRAVENMVMYSTYNLQLMFALMRKRTDSDQFQNKATQAGDKQTPSLPTNKRPRT